MDQSLDSIIKSKKKEQRPRPARKPAAAPKKTFKSSGGGAGRGGNKSAAPVQRRQQAVVVQRDRNFRERERDRDNNNSRNREPTASSSSIFDRLGTTGGGNGRSGTKVVISGLTKAVSTTDVTQLCDSIGEVTDVHKKFDTAEVVFAKRSDAISAIKKFNGLTLDGVAMKVSLAGERGQPNPFDPNAEEDSVRATGSGRANVREGLFGTRGDDAVQSRGRDRDGGINFGYKKPAPSTQGITVTINNNRGGDRGRDSRGSGGRGGKGGKGGKGGGGRGGGGKGGKGARVSDPVKSVDDLDREMDEYLSAR